MASVHYTLSSLSSGLIATFSVFAGITTITFILRIYVRVRLIKSFGPDDWTAALGWLLYIMFSGFGIASSCHGLGQHESLIQPPSEIPIALKLTLITESLYAATNMVVKLSICLMLLRFVMEPFHKVLLYVVIGLTSVSSIAFLFVFVFQCTPVSFFWQRTLGDVVGRCVNPLVVVIGAYIYSAVCVICDWTMALLPWFIVRKTRMDFRTKTMVVSVLAMGSIASVAAIGRLGYLAQIRNPDPLYELSDAALWCACETGLGLFASCAATLKPLLKSIPSHQKHSCVTSDSYPMQNPAAASNHSNRPPLHPRGILNTIVVCVKERQGHYRAEDEARLGHVVGDSEKASAPSSRQETEMNDMYGDLPVLREHQYENRIIPRQV